MNFGSLICSWNKGSTRGYWIPCWAVAVELFICLSLKGGSSWTSASQHTCLTEVLFFNIPNIFILLKPGLTALRVLEKLCPLEMTAQSFFIIYLFGVLLRSKVNYKCLCQMWYSSFPRPMSSASCYFAVKKFPKKASRSVFTEGVCYSACSEATSESSYCNNRFKLDFSHLPYVKLASWWSLSFGLTFFYESC